MDALGASLSVSPPPAPARLVVARLVARPVVTLTVRFPPDEETPVRTLKLARGRNLRRSVAAARRRRGARKEWWGLLWNTHPQQEQG